MAVGTSAVPESGVRPHDKASDHAYPPARRPLSVPSLALLLLLVLIGFAAAALGLRLANLPPKRLILAFALLASLVLSLVSRSPKQVFLFLYIIALGYNRQYYSFDELHGDLGSRGLYWIPADAFLMMLYLHWLYNLAVHRTAWRPIAPGAVWLLPLVGVAAASSLGMDDPRPGLFETLRLAKLMLLLVYLRFNLGRRELRTCIVALGVMIILQCALGMMQVVTTNAQGGLMSLAAGGAGSGTVPGPPVASEMAHRATGTFGHPNFLAPYLLMTVPPFIALALGGRSLGTVRRSMAAVVALCGLLAIALTQSRAPIALAIASTLGVLLMLAARRVVGAARVIGLCALGALALAVAAAPLAVRIHERLTGDFAVSVDFRLEYNAVAVAIWREAPLLGLGPNSFVKELGRHAPVLKAVNDELEEYRLQANARAAAPVHNVYLLILAEMGAAGLTAFVLLLLGALRAALAATRAIPGAGGLIGAGILWGLIAQVLQQSLDFSLWWDPSLFTMGLLLAVAGAIPASQQVKGEGSGRERNGCEWYGGHGPGGGARRAHGQHRHPDLQPPQ